MPAPLLAAAAPVVIDSATDSNGLVNQAFKITVLIGLALAIFTGIFVIYQLTSLFDNITELGGSAGNILGAGFAIISPLGFVLTSIAGGFMRG
tara:strand:- start:42 stop:320 length:279 start_codon:yes stop_codon:yes gene_type:complete